MDTKIKETVSTYFKEHDLGVIVKWGKPRFAELGSGREISETNMVGRLTAIGLTLGDADLEEILTTFPTQTIHSRDEQIPIDETITDAMKVIGMEIKPQCGCVLLSVRGGIVTIEVASVLLSIAIQTQLRRRVAKENISDYLTSLVVSKRLDDNVEFGKEVATDPTLVPKSIEMSERLMKIVAGPDYIPMHSILIRHLIWVIKRRHKQYPPKDVLYPIFLNLYSQLGNTGKSSFWEAFFSIVPPTLKKNENHLDKLINDERKMFSLLNNLVIVCGELGNLDKTCVEILKNAIDMWVISFRQLGYNADISGPNMAVLVGTSNFPLKKRLLGGPNPRKWFEIPFYYYGDASKQSDMSFIPLQTFDYKSLWRSVDESQPTPLAAVYPEFLKLAAEVCGNSESASTDVFFRDFILQHTNQQRDYAFKEIFSAYKEVATHFRVNNSTFSDLLHKAGFKHIVKSHGNRWRVPSFEESSLFTEEERVKIRADLKAEAAVKALETQIKNEV